MSSDGSTLVRALFDETVAAHHAFASDRLATLVAAADAIRRALAGSQKVLTFGNGGSAADAQHFAAELVGRFEIERRGFAAIALTTDSSILTAVANDYGFEQVFSRQIDALGRPGDIALGISTSGRSPSVVAGLASARRGGLVTIALTGGDGGACAQAADIHVNVPVQSTARVQEVHRTILHAICAIVDADSGQSRAGER